MINEELRQNRAVVRVQRTCCANITNSTIPPFYLIIFTSVAVAVGRSRVIVGGRVL